MQDSSDFKIPRRLPTSKNPASIPRPVVLFSNASKDITEGKLSNE
jgi:hypothetical protein